MLQKYRYLCALAKEKHFGRAALSCNVSQPTLSNGLRQLEERLNAQLIERDQKFIGLTHEGLRVLEHAKRMLAEQELLLQSLNNKPTEITTRLRIGAIPTAIPFVSGFIQEVAKVFPKVTYSVAVLTSSDLAGKIHDFEIDMGLSYMESDMRSSLQCAPVYVEEYYFIVQRQKFKGTGTSISWKEASEYPLCLLTPNMQNRRMADAVFKEVGRVVSPIVEANSLINLYTNVKHGIGAAIVPYQLLELSQQDPDLIALRLVDPVVSHKIGLMSRTGEPSSFLVNEIFKLTRAGKLTVDGSQGDRNMLSQHSA